MSRQQRRAAERAAAKETKKQFVERVHGEVKESTSIRELWLTYFHNRFELLVSRPLEPEHIALLEEVFYAGALSMAQVSYKLATESEDEDEGAIQMERIHQELQLAVERLTR